LSNMKHSIIAAVTLAVLLPGGVLAQVTVSDDFTQAHDASDWSTFDGACLTAGDGTGKIPKCVGLPYYQGQTLVGGQSGTLPDNPGFGALRFTNGFTTGGSGFASGFNQAGGIISNFTFNAGAGVSILFKTVTYRGNSGGNGGGGTVDAHDGADGMSFFLIDASYQPYDMGAFGGSLGYSCSNANDDPTLRADGTKRQYDGLMGAYLGLGIDEFGNFLNYSDNTHSGPGLQANRIGLRGAGSISWKSLNTAYPNYYPSSWSQSDQDTAVQKTCKSGYLRDRYGNYYTSTTDPTQTSNSHDNGIPVPDYAMISDAAGNPALKVLTTSTGAGVNIANESALTRDQTQPDATRAIPIAYNLKITQDGLLSFSYSYNNGAFLPVITGQSITASNGTLPNLLRFGFAGSTGGSTNIHEILCFQATPSNQASTSIGVNQPAATKISSGTQAYLASYFQSDWTGRLTANPLLYDPTLGIYASPTSNWDASCNLTGVATCTTTGATNVPAQAPSKRNILTWSDTGKAGIPFQWTSLTTTEQAALDAGDTTPYNANRLQYLRGDRTNEINSVAVGLFRKRDNVLADIVDSSPVWVGNPVDPYPLTWKDLAHTSMAPPENGTGANSYPSFAAANKTRLNVVYSGANDGLLHAFRSGSFDANGNFVNTATTPNDGAEVLAYMPGAVLNTIHNSTDTTLDYSSSQYGHNFFVDATPRGDDLFYSNSWHTWLVGGLGAGGNAIYALDVTDPTQFSENNAASLVIGEWTSATISCTNVTNCGNNLGNTYGVPVIRRLHNGTWGVIFGNGFGSSTGDAGIFVMTVDSKGIKTFYYLSAGQSGKADGIAAPSPADLDGDRIVDYVYAGDLNGNVWRFDLTNTDPTKWAVTTHAIFTDPTGRPITSSIGIVGSKLTSSGPPRVILDFGTGRRIPITNSSPQTYDSGSHYLYGVWDSDMSAWNALGSLQYVSLPSPPTVGQTLLQVQTLTVNGDGSLSDTNNTVCWADQASCSSTPQYGFYTALPNTGEQTIFNPLIYGTEFIVNTTIPSGASSATSCKAITDSADTFALEAATGTPVPGLFNTGVVGGQTNGSGTPFVACTGAQCYIVTQTTGGGAPGPFKCTALTCSQPTPPPPPGGPNSGKRLTWIERR
jgi:type IV pilus assembly protein PilY1